MTKLIVAFRHFENASKIHILAIRLIPWMSWGSDVILFAIFEIYKLLYYFSYLFTFDLISFSWHHSFHTARVKFAHHIIFFRYLRNSYFISTPVCVPVNCTVFNIFTAITFIVHTECWVVSCVVSNLAGESAVCVHVQRELVFWIWRWKQRSSPKHL